jgi:hypothetical protein
MVLGCWPFDAVKCSWGRVAFISTPNSSYWLCSVWYGSSWNFRSYANVGCWCRVCDAQVPRALLCCRRESWKVFWPPSNVPRRTSSTYAGVEVQRARQCGSWNKGIIITTTVIFVYFHAVVVEKIHCTVLNASWLVSRMWRKYRCTRVFWTRQK